MDKTMQRINILKGQCGIDEETWRGQVLPRFGGTPDADGRVSLKSVPFGKRFELLKELQSKAPKNAATAWRAKRIAKIKALWTELHKAGVVRALSETAMRSWCARFHKARKLEEAPAETLDRCIEGLKDWARREGFTVRTVNEHGHTEIYREV